MRILQLQWVFCACRQAAANKLLEGEVVYKLWLSVDGTCSLTSVDSNENFLLALVHVEIILPHVGYCRSELLCMSARSWRMALLACWSVLQSTIPKVAERIMTFSNRMEAVVAAAGCQAVLPYALCSNTAGTRQVRVPSCKSCTRFRTQCRL